MPLFPNPTKPIRTTGMAGQVKLSTLGRFMDCFIFLTKIKRKFENGSGLEQEGRKQGI